MRSRIVFIIGVMILMQACTRPSNRAEVDKSFTEMQSEIAKQSLEDSWKTMGQFEDKLKDLRANKPRQSEEDEIYFDRLMLGMKDIPRTKLNETQCADLQAKMIAENDPTSTPENRSPALTRVLELLDSLCGKK